MKKLNLILFFIFFLVSTAIFGQDQHFTQFYASPTTLNPALSGAFVGKYRLSLIYHDQWRRVLDGPYVTYSAAMDFRFKVNYGKAKKYRDAVGAGVLFYSDKTPGVDFSTNKILIGGAYHKALDKANNQYLSLGGQMVIAQRSVNYENITFQDEWNGTDGYTDQTSEILPGNNFGFFDMNVGINYTYAPKRGIGVYAGFAMHHILEPQLSFYYDKDEPDTSGDNLLHKKYTGHINIDIPIKEGIKLSPRALVFAQGPHFESVAGTNIRLALTNTNRTALHLGAWGRIVKNDGEYGMDSAIGMVGIELNNFLLGVSYDANLTDLSQSKRGQGAFELSIAYLGEYENDIVVCPSF